MRFCSVLDEQKNDNFRRFITFNVGIKFRYFWMIYSNTTNEIGLEAKYANCRRDSFLFDYFIFIYFALNVLTNYGIQLY